MVTPCPISEAASQPNLGLIFRQVRDAMWARMEVQMAHTGHELNFSQFVTIKQLALGAQGVTELARAAHLNPGAMTRLLDKLEARGLLARVADPGDRRALKINLTESGIAIWQDIHECGQRVYAEAMSGIPDDERDQLMRLLEQVRDNLTTATP